MQIARDFLKKVWIFSTFFRARSLHRGFHLGCTACQLFGGQGRGGCGGLENAAKRALQASGKFIPWQVVTISTDGRILD